MSFCFSSSFLFLRPFFVLWVFFCNSARLQLCSPFLHSFLVRYCFTAFYLFSVCLFYKFSLSVSVCSSKPREGTDSFANFGTQFDLKHNCSLQICYPSPMEVIYSQLLWPSRRMFKAREKVNDLGLSCDFALWHSRRSSKCSASYAGNAKALILECYLFRILEKVPMWPVKTNINKMMTLCIAIDILKWFYSIFGALKYSSHP